MTRSMFVKTETWMAVEQIAWLKPALWDEDYQVMEETLCGKVFGFVSRKVLGPIIFPSED